MGQSGRSAPQKLCDVPIDSVHLCQAVNTVFRPRFLVNSNKTPCSAISLTGDQQEEAFIKLQNEVQQNFHVKTINPLKCHVPVASEKGTRKITLHSEKKKRVAKIYVRLA